MDTIAAALDAVHYKLPKIKYRLLEPMKRHTSFRIGGPVRAMFFPDRHAALTGLCGVLNENGVAPFIMGKGTNLLAEDGELDLVVVNTRALNSREQTGETEITAGAGIPLSKLAVFASECGLSGFEFAHGIPGTLGGAVAMNAGAYGGEMKAVVRSTKVFNHESGVFTITGEEHMFSYRQSRFAQGGGVILSSVIELQKGDTAGIREKMDELGSRRGASQPLDLPSAGSAFKRPGSGYAASLIEQAGLRGYIYGKAQVSEKHAGFIVNRGGATFSDVMAVIEHVRETVLRLFGVELELEIKIVTSMHGGGSWTL